MKKFLVIGNPIQHSLSPKLHNYWLKNNNIDAIYEKKLVNKKDFKEIISKVRSDEIKGINITVPFKQEIIPFIDQLSDEAKQTNSVNTIYKKEEKIFGHNTDIAGFELGLRFLNFEIKGKQVFILGAGGVVPSIIFALQKLGVSKIILSNRSKEKIEVIKKNFKNIDSIEWGKNTNFDLIINATSIGLDKKDSFKIDYSEGKSGKFFYDVIYNPSKTAFLQKAEERGNKIENGKMMFIYQAHQAFTLWHGIMPKIDEETIKLLD
tara:strand:- start:1274 stop:2065 length:792 start_codon:yes stop_codon:yes gene_type:complete